MGKKLHSYCRDQFSAWKLFLLKLYFKGFLFSLRSPFFGNIYEQLLFFFFFWLLCPSSMILKKNEEKNHRKLLKLCLIVFYCLSVKPPLCSNKNGSSHWEMCLENMCSWILKKIKGFFTGIFQGLYLFLRNAYGYFKKHLQVDGYQGI